MKKITEIMEQASSKEMKEALQKLFDEYENCVDVYGEHMKVDVTERFIKIFEDLFDALLEEEGQQMELALKHVLKTYHV